ncbi:MAG: alpha/beta hydrolase [Leptospiraceae bacterium]|nr:alpha/beta hydrolase [Leptospiraceae bacterium]MDW7976810.1 alpha/beta hydrolase [Leptospiraceae bacterium]
MKETPNYYIHPNSPSYLSKLLELLLKIQRKKFAFEKAMNSYQKSKKISKEIYEFPKPPKFMFSKKTYQVQSFQNRNVFVFNPQKEEKISILILVLHGGAFLRSFYLFHWLMIKKLQKISSAIIYAPDYPTVPHYKYKEIIAFCKNFYDYLKTNEKDIIIIGDSAGGNLALVLLQKLSKDEMPKKVILFSPWVDLSMENPKIENIESKDFILTRNGLMMAGKLYSENNPKNPEVSPLYHPYDFLPEIHLFMGTHDILFPDAKEFFFKNPHPSFYFYEYPYMQHDWMILDLIPFDEAKDVWLKVRDILNDT